MYTSFKKKLAKKLQAWQFLQNRIFWIQINLKINQNLTSQSVKCINNDADNGILELRTVK